jgi:ribosome-binding factor A
VLIPRELRDVRVQGVTLTGADVSRDLANARIYFTVFGKDSQPKVASTQLNRAAGRLRHELKKVLRLRHVPMLSFKYDESVDRGARLSQLIDQVSSGSGSGDDGKAS